MQGSRTSKVRSPSRLRNNLQADSRVSNAENQTMPRLQSRLGEGNDDCTRPYSNQAYHNLQRQLYKSREQQLTAQIQRQRSAISELSRKNAELSSQNASLSESMRCLLRDVRVACGLQDSPENFSYNNDNEPISFRQGPENPYQAQRKYLIVKELAQNLERQNKMLIEIKQKYSSQILKLTESNAKLSQECQQLRQSGATKSRKLQQLHQVNQQQSASIAQLKGLLQQQNQELTHLSARLKEREEHMQVSHDRFHRELSRVKERLGKQRARAQGYRQQRDELALEMQRARLEIGMVGLKRYFPDQSEDDDL